MKVSEIIALRIENSALKLQLLQVQATAVHTDQARLIEEAREQVKADASALYNTDTREFQAAPTLVKGPE